MNDPTWATYWTLAGSAEALYTVQRSRFLALASPAADEAAAREAVQQMQRRYHDARHVCSAWRLGAPPRTVEARQDAGEPAGTAGAPILAVIRQADLVDTVVVVARYFGGIKLGTGGLARAYGLAAREALASAPRRIVRSGFAACLGFAYAHQPVIARLLQQYGGRTLDEAYGVEVVWRVWLPAATAEHFAAAVREAAAGAVPVDLTPSDQADP